MLAAFAYRWFARLRQRRRQGSIEYSQRLEQQVKDRTAELFQRNDELLAVNRKLEDASLTDSLTGLSNRRFLMAQMPQDVAVVERFYRKLDPSSPPPLPGNRPDFALMMIDLDGLKGINDTYGHAAGDKALVEIREILERACRKSDTIARWGATSSWWWPATWSPRWWRPWPSGSGAPWRSTPSTWGSAGRFTRPSIGFSLSAPSARGPATWRSCGAGGHHH